MNKVTLKYLDTPNRTGRLLVNSKPVSIHFIQIYKNNKDFNGKQGYSCQVANDWNISNPLSFQAPTIKGLLGRLKHHKYNLKPF